MSVGRELAHLILEVILQVLGLQAVVDLAAGHCYLRFLSCLVASVGIDNLSLRL